ncbi:MAG TPA: TetR/AcrR family transcriptional regulator [Sulfurovum sp.]|nr:TetR/AcrR family transcriptional regulator [Sulfurovum sp.]
MAIIVDKEKKRTDIACSCKDILLEYGIKNLTISHIAKTAGVGKGTIYEYFENKEDIVFEIITSIIAEHEQQLHEIINLDISSKEKLFHFFNLIYENKNSQEQLNIYREFLAISITNGTAEMIDFNKVCREKFSNILTQIIQEGIDKKELHKAAQDLVSGLITFGLGLVVEAHTVSLNAKEEIKQYIDALFTIMETKENK